MEKWTVTIAALPDALRIQVKDAMRDDLLQARLPYPLDHPRALLTLLEGLALWMGAPLCAAVSVADTADPSHAIADGWLGASALVRFEVDDRNWEPFRIRLRRSRSAKE